MKLVSLLIAFMVISALRSHAQSPDYIVMAKGDTLRGWADGSGRYNVKFRADPEGKWQKFDSKTVKTYYIAKDKEKKISVPMPLLDPKFPQPKFEDAVFEGKINVVKENLHAPGISTGFGGMVSVTGAGTNTVKYYIQKGPARAKAVDTKWPSYNVLTNSSRKEFGELIADQPELFKKYQAEEKITSDIFLEYVGTYNKM